MFKGAFSKAEALAFRRAIVVRAHGCAPVAPAIGVEQKTEESPKLLLWDGSRGWLCRGGSTESRHWLQAMQVSSSRGVKGHIRDER